MDEARSQIGKRYWFRDRIAELCPGPTDLKPCGEAPASAFVVEDATVDSFGSSWVRIRFDTDGKSGYTRYAVGTAKLAWTTADPSLAERDRQQRQQQRTAERAADCTGGPLRLGIDEAAAIRAWCFPTSIKTSEHRGRKREQWLYKDRGRLFFDDGILTGIERR